MDGVERFRNIGVAGLSALAPDLAIAREVAKVSLEIFEGLDERCPYEQIAAAVRLCESPIERIAFSQMVAANALAGVPSIETEARETMCFWPVIVPQVAIDRYRVDFMIYGGGRRVALECDGADFHEQMKDQFRDSRLEQVVGIRTWRVTGSEIMRGPQAIEAAIRSINTHLYG